MSLRARWARLRISAGRRTEELIVMTLAVLLTVVAVVAGVK
jgi:hypothetical protein